MDSASRIGELRAQVRLTTERIIELLSQRLDLSREIGSAKLRSGLPVEDTAAEAALRHHILRRCAELGIDGTRALRILNTLVDESVHLQTTQRTSTYTSHQEILRLARELEGSGRRIIHLEIGEPDTPPPKSVIEEASRSLYQGYIHYSSAQGMKDLRESLAAYHKERSGVDIGPDQVLVTPGSRFALYLAVANVLRPGGGMVSFEPAWPAYRECTEAVGGRFSAVKTRLEDGWLFRAEELQNCLEAGAEMLVVNNPCNPTGKVLRSKDLEVVLSEAKKKGLTILSDEVYSIFSPNPTPSILGATDSNYILISSFSKAFRMTGFRIGYLISSKELVARLTTMQSLLVTNVPEFVQRAALRALDFQDDALRYASVIRRRIKKAVEALNRLPVSFSEPDGGFYVFPRINVEGRGGDEFAARLLREKGVAVTPGTSFGDYPQFIRISVCQRSDLLMDGLAKMGEFLQ